MKMVQLVGAIAYDVRAIKHNTQNPTPPKLRFVSPALGKGRGLRGGSTVSQCGEVVRCWGFPKCSTAACEVLGNECKISNVF